MEHTESNMCAANCSNIHRRTWTDSCSSFNKNVQYTGSEICGVVSVEVKELHEVSKVKEVKHVDSYSNTKIP